MNKFENNPFDRSALKEYKLLAGRAAEFRKIRFLLRNSAKQTDRIKSVLITGSRGVGKTSFLNLIENECLVNNLIPIRINLSETNSTNSHEFFWYLFTQVMNKLYSLELFEGKGGAIDSTIQKILHGNGMSDEANWIFNMPILRRNYLSQNNNNFEFDLFAADLKLIRTKLIEYGDLKFNANTKIVFLVDESQNIYSNSKIIKEIRFIIQNQDLGLGFVFAGDTTFESSTWEDVFGGSYRDFEMINLNYFGDLDDVKEYFTKSLESIGWITKEIEETLFYRFKLATRQIFQLTSGNPAWINIIAYKMFERCMNMETNVLKFDRQAQNEVKYLLESNGKIDKIKLDVIENLSPKLKKWLIEIFACELQSLEEVYFYAKFKLVNDDYLTKDSFINFCQYLIKEGIIIFIDEEQKIEENSNSNSEILKRPYISFDINADTIKQWLQINSDGKYRFSLNLPGTRYAKYINDQLTTELVSSLIIGDIVKDGDNKFRLSKAIEDINNGIFDINEYPYELILTLYKAYKRLASSQNRQLLYIELSNLISGKVLTWNVYNYDDKEKVIGFRESNKKIENLEAIVSENNGEDVLYTLKVVIDKAEFPDITKLQSLIIKSGDKKKFGIILSEKDSELIETYIKQSDLKTSIDIASFFYELFEEGHDLTIRNLNNSAYVFIMTGEIEKATEMLTEAVRHEKFSTFKSDNETGFDLALYNMAIIHAINKNYQKAIESFDKVILFCEEYEKGDGNAGVLHILKTDENNNVFIHEVKEGDVDFPRINCVDFARENIQLLNTKEPIEA